MESFETSTCPSALPVVTRLAERAGYRTAGHLAVERFRTSVAPITSAAGTATRPASVVNVVNVVDEVSDLSDMTAVKGFATPAGIRSWSPPV